MGTIYESISSPLGSIWTKSHFSLSHVLWYKLTLYIILIISLKIYNVYKSNIYSNIFNQQPSVTITSYSYMYKMCQT